jgi:hypothetical protein
MPFFVEIPNVAVVPVKDPNSPITISEVESDFAPVHDVNAKTPTTHKRKSLGLRLMNPPSGRIPEGLVVLPLWFFVLVFLRRTMIVRTRRRAAQADGPGIFLTSLLGRLDTDFSGIILSYLPPPDRYFLRHRSSSAFVDRHVLARAFNIDIDVSFCMHAATEKEVESADCKQDNDDNGDRSHTTTRTFSHISSRN